MKQRPVKKHPPRQNSRSVGEKEVKKSGAGLSPAAAFMGNNALIITMALVSMLLLIIFFEFITGTRYYLFKDIGSDSINGYYPYILNSVRYLGEEGFPQWSFAVGMGQSIFPGSFNDPFAYIISLFGPEGVAYGIIVSDFAKFIVACLFFFLYLRVLDLGKTSSIIGALLFSLSGFMVVGGSWYAFSLEVVYMAFLLYAFEKLYKQGNWILFPVAIALIGMYVPFNIYLYGLFLIFYTLFRFFTDDAPALKPFIKLVATMAGLTLLGILISSVFFFPNLQRLIDSPRVTGNSSYFETLMSKPVFSLAPSDHYVTAVMRSFGNDLLGNGSNYKGWYNYLEAPLFYIGLLPLLLFPQVFTLISKRRKFIYAAFLLLYLLPVIFPFFRYAFWAFTGDYYRGFSFFFAFVILLFSLQVISELEKARKINLIILPVTLGILIILLFYPYENIRQNIRQDLQSVTAIFLILYAVILVLFNFVQNNSMLRIALILLVFVELAYFNRNNVGDRVTVTKTEWQGKDGFNDYTVDAVSWIKSNDKGFYRINKDYSSGPAIHRSMNDALIQDYYGSPCYSSFNQKYFIRFQEEAGAIEKGNENQTRWAPGLSKRPLLQIMGSVKYNLSNRQKSPFLNFGYDSIHKTGDVKILKNRFFLPLGYAYDRYIPISRFRELPQIQRDIAMLRAFVAEEPLDPSCKQLNEYVPGDTSKLYTSLEIGEFVQELKKDTLQIISFSENKITGTINLNEPKMLFFSIPYDKGWQGMVDDKPQEPVLINAGFMGLYLEKGDHTVQLSYGVHQLTLYTWLSMAGLCILALLVYIRNKKFIQEYLKHSS
jgi:uncharacterized membrane protein YfhO